MTVRNVIFAPIAVKQLDKLPRDTALRIANAVSELADDPLAGKPLQGELKGSRSLRVGDYRVIYQLRSAQVEILRIGNRREVYR